MLTHLIRRELNRAWISPDVAAEDGLHRLQILSSTDVNVDDGSRQRILPPSVPPAFYPRL
jgi:hypothetical protein